MQGYTMYLHDTTLPNNNLEYGDNIDCNKYHGVNSELISMCFRNLVVSPV